MYYVGGMQKKAIGYVRVSTKKQRDDGISLEAQEARIRAWAEFNGYELLGIEIDAGISGKNMTARPALQRALVVACKEKAVLVGYSLSRIGRSAIDLLSISERLKKAGAGLASLTESIDTTTATGNMFVGLLAVLAQFERDQTSERTSAVVRYKQSKNEFIGGNVPYGHRIKADGVHKLREGHLDDCLGCVNLEIHEGEQQVIAAARAAQAEGLSLRAIGTRLESMGMFQRNGAVKWNPKIVRGLLPKAA